MLQPRPLLSTSTSRLCRRCLFHTVSPRLYPEAQIKIEPPVDPARVKPTHIEEDNLEVAVDSEPTRYLEEDRAVRLKTYKPRTPGVRHLIRPVNDHLWKGRAYLPLTFPRKGHHIGGRNRTGQITVRHRGGGHKRRIRMLDFNRMAPGQHRVERIEHDPGRSAHIALLSCKAGDKVNYSYIVAAQGMRAGENVESFRSGIPEKLRRELGGKPDAGMLASKTAFRGNCMPLHMVPPGTTVYNVGLRKNGPAQLCRSAGSFAMVVSKYDSDPKYSDYVGVKLKSGEIRRIQRDCCATIGIASNMHYHRRQLGKAGRSRWLGIRPTVRGVAMNAVDHPHGGGRGKSKGNRHPVSPWGQLTKSGFKTRRKSNVNRFLVTERPRSLGKQAAKTKKKRENR